MAGEMITPKEFCAELSTRDNRVELVSGFFHHLVHVRKISKTDRETFEREFKAFITQPV